MNRTSAGDGGGSFARVDEGSVFVGLPGAPGWTTTGFFGSTCCEYTDRDNKKRSVDADSCKLFIAFVGGPYLITNRVWKRAARGQCVTPIFGAESPAFWLLTKHQNVDWLAHRDVTGEGGACTHSCDDGVEIGFT